jgi:hypothetical protein
VNTDASQEINTIVKDIAMTIAKIVGILAAAILIFGLLLRTVQEEHRQEFMRAYGSCNYDVKTRSPLAVRKDQQGLLFLCLAGKGYRIDESIEYLKDPRYRRENL